MLVAIEQPPLGVNFTVLLHPLLRVCSLPVSLHFQRVPPEMYPGGGPQDGGGEPGESDQAPLRLRGGQVERCGPGRHLDGAGRAGETGSAVVGGQLGVHGPV